MKAETNCFWIEGSSGAARVEPGDETMVFAGDFYLAPEVPEPEATRLLEPELLDRIRSSSLAVVNLEGPLAGTGAKQGKVGPTLAIHPRGAAVLREMGFRAAGLANNHIMDLGPKGLERTLAESRAAGLETFGAGHAEQAAGPLRWSMPSGCRIALFGFCEHEFGIAGEDTPGAAWLRPEAAEEAVRKAKTEADVVVVCAHGGVEGLPFPPPERRRQMRRLGEAGADVVIGHHAHVPQGWERWGRSVIFYGLGDFYMDAVWGRRFPERDWSYLPRIVLRQGRVAGVEVSLYERVQERLAPLGRRRDPGWARKYLEELSLLAAGEELAALWQEAAVELFLNSYRRYFGVVFPMVETWERSGRGRVRQTLRALLHVAGLWLGRDAGRGLHSREAHLLLLNLMRCESHRWAIETALAVLGGDCKDLRSEASKRRLDKLRADMALG